MPFALDGNPTPSEISEAINYLLANFGSNFTTDPVTGQIIAPGGFVLAYLYQYLAVKYADSADGSTNFGDTPTNRQYYGVRNTDSSTESTNPSDYVWTKVSGGFGTTKFLFYQTNGGRQIQFVIATSVPDSTWNQESGVAINLDVITGSSGYMAAFPTIYKWTSSSTPPTRPTATSTYTWATASFTPPSGWTSSITSNTTPGNYLWSITYPLVDVSTTETSILDWTSLINLVVNISYNGTNGTTGSTGPRSASGYVYYALASSTAPTAPTLSGFNFDTGSFSSITTNWSTTFTAPPATDTTKFWAVRYAVSEATYGGTQTVTVSAVFNWTNFNGLVTFTNLATNTGTTFIDGGNITTDTIVVGSLKNNTNGFYNTWVNFALGSDAKIGPYAAGGSFIPLNDEYFGVISYNPMGGYAIGAASQQSSSAVIGAMVATGYASLTGGGVVSWKNQATLGTGVSAGTFQSGGASNMQTAINADIRLGYYNGSTTYAAYIVSGATYPFTAGHDALQLLAENEPDVGDLMVDVSLFAAPSVNDCITVMSKSSIANQKGIVGVYVGSTGTGFVPAALGEYETGGLDAKSEFVLKPEYADIYSTYRCIGINAIGEGKINVCGEGGSLEIGDLISSSSMQGKGMKQADDIMRGYTVAKCRENVTFSSPTEVKQVACIYVCG